MLSAFSHFRYNPKGEKMKKCDTKCEANRNLWLRNRVYYYIVELPRVDAKRRYLRLSLKTDNYYEAKEKIKYMSKTNRSPLIAKKDTEDPLWYYKANFPKTGGRSHHINQPVQARKISEVLESMLLKSKCKVEEKTRKRKRITELLNDVGLTLNNDYSEFHNVKMIQTISENVDNTETLGDNKRKYIRYLKELARHASDVIDPDNYKSNVVAAFPEFKGTKKSEKNPYDKYTDVQLLEIFDPKHKFFKDNPDLFFACLIAMFTGARANSATTLQYDDILIEEGVDCIYFRENHPIKALKNEASERMVPINPQLLDIGFVDYVRRQQSKLKKSGKDFIFQRCMTSGGVFNNKLTTRTFSDFLTDIGIKTPGGKKLTFHSFRKTANDIMRKAGIQGTEINNIIGWEGKDTREQSYTINYLNELKAEVDRFCYDFLQPHFDKWKVIMSKK
jgi:integrase